MAGHETQQLLLLDLDSSPKMHCRWGLSRFLVHGSGIVWSSCWWSVQPGRGGRASNVTERKATSGVGDTPLFHRRSQDKNSSRAPRSPSSIHAGSRPCPEASPHKSLRIHQDMYLHVFMHVPAYPCVHLRTCAYVSVHVCVHGSDTCRPTGVHVGW